MREKQRREGQTHSNTLRLYIPSVYFRDRTGIARSQSGHCKVIYGRFTSKLRRKVILSWGNTQVFSVAVLVYPGPTISQLSFLDLHYDSRLRTSNSASGFCKEHHVHKAYALTHNCTLHRQKNSLIRRTLCRMLPWHLCASFFPPGLIKLASVFFAGLV